MKRITSADSSWTGGGKNEQEKSEESPAPSARHHRYKHSKLCTPFHDLLRYCQSNFRFSLPSIACPLLYRNIYKFKCTYVSTSCSVTQMYLLMHCKWKRYSTCVSRERLTGNVTLVTRVKLPLQNASECNVNGGSGRRNERGRGDPLIYNRAMSFPSII